MHKPTGYEPHYPMHIQVNVFLLLNSEIFLCSKGKIFQDRYCLLFPVFKLKRKVQITELVLGLTALLKREQAAAWGERAPCSWASYPGCPEPLILLQEEGCSGRMFLDKTAGLGKP